MKKLNLTFMALFCLAGLTSCFNDMDVQPQDDDVVGGEVLYATPQGYRQAMAGVYGNLSLTGTADAGSSFLQGIDAGTSNFNRCLWYMQELTTDEVVWSYENDAGTADLQRNIWTADNVILLGMFSRTMAEVALANDFIRNSAPETVASKGFTSEEVATIADYRNEARVMRAFAYYTLMDLFGKAPFITENDPVNTAGPEYNREQLFDFVENELTDVMPLLKPARSNQYGRIDQGFAQMVLAKMYLNAEVYTGTPRWADCMAMCEAIMGAGYSLNANYLNNFKADNHTSPEMIFTLQSDGLVTQNYGATTVMVNGQIGEWEANGSAFGIDGWGGALRVRKQFVQKFDGVDFDFDARKTIGTGVAGDPDKQRSIDIQDISIKTQGYIISKWSNIASNGSRGASTTFADTDYVLYRLADVYLMYAEAAVRTNTNLGTALNLVNQLRQRANGGSTSANIIASQLTLDFLIDERARELHWEGHRRQDLIRFNKYTGGQYNWAWKGNAANGVSLPAYRKLFPIPTASLNANRNLTQNLGY